MLIIFDKSFLYFFESILLRGVINEQMLDAQLRSYLATNLFIMSSQGQ